jgi:hypothetical protein
MPVHVRECTTIGQEGGGPGLLLTVPSAGRASPRLRVEAASDLHFRFVAQGRPFAWASVREWWSEAAFVRDASAGVAAALPPITMPVLRAMDAEPRTDAWWSRWMRFFAEQLDASREGPLFGGLWGMTRGRFVPFEQAERYPCMPGMLDAEPPPVHSLERILQLPGAVFEGWTWPDIPEHQGALFPVRAPSPAEDGRVRAWRKRARDGTLPPVLLFYVHVLGKHLVVDGHDRAHAALLEGVEPPLCVLWPAQERYVFPHAVEDLERLHELSARQPELPWPEMLNRAAAMTYSWGSTHHAYLRAYQVRGGMKTWRDEVARRLEALRGEVEEDVAAYCLSA